MERRTLLSMLLGVTAVILGVVSMLWTTRHNRVELTGEIFKVRTHSVEPTAGLAILDFRVTNPSTQRFVVRDITAYLESTDGKTHEGQNVSEMDAVRLFQYFPVIGQKYNTTLVTRERINSGQTMDRMLAVRFPVPEAEIQQRKAIRLSIRDVDGAVTEIK